MIAYLNAAIYNCLQTVLPDTCSFRNVQVHFIGICCFPKQLQTASRANFQEKIWICP